MLAVVTLVGALFCLASPQVNQPLGGWLVPAAVIVLLEAFSGPIALTPAGFLALLAAPPGGARVACLLAIGLLAWRVAARPRLTLAQGLNEALPVTLTGAMILAVPTPYTLLVALNAYLFLSIPQARRSPSLYPVRLGVLAVGALCSQPASWLAGVPVLLALRWGAMARLRAEELSARADQDRALSLAQERLEALEARLQRATDELQARQTELALLSESGQRFLSSPSFEHTVESLLDAAKRLAFSDSLAVFTPDGEGRLLPLAYRSPHAETLRDAALHHVQEPSVERAFREGRPIVGDFDQGPIRLFPGEASLAVPLPEFGVLYLGAGHRHYGQSEQHLVSLLAQHAALALAASRDRNKERAALALHQKANRRLEEWLEQLSRLLEATGSMALLLEPQPLLERVAELLPQMAPVTGWWLECRRPSAQLGRCEWANQPLQEDMVAFPFPGDRGQMVLQGRFSRAHRELLSLLAYQASALLEGIALHQEVVDAYHKLRESEQQLIQAAKMAAVGQLAAGVAHELNTPLGSIRMAAELAARQVARNPEAAVERLASVQTAATRAQEIVSKLLYYSRDARIDKQPFCLNQVVRDALELIGHGLDARVDFQPGNLPELRGNANEIQQVVTNLVLNARDAAGDSPIVLRTFRSDGLATLTVEDCGPGIPPEVLPRIFEPFFTTKPVGAGTGLGLSISQQLVERHQGTLTVDSRPGEGTTFSMSLPV